MAEEKRTYGGLLPLGSVVKLTGVDPFIMVSGRIVCAQDEEKIYDYVGVVYPQGVGGEDELIFFDREAIEDLMFIGYQDEYELMYRSEVLAQLGELKVVDGEMVEV